MALVKQGNKVIAKITDLTVESVINDGDRIVFWSNTGNEAATIDYSNFKVDLDHTTFGDTFKQIVDFATTANSWVSSMTESFDELDEKMNTVIEGTTQTNNEILAIKMMIKMILGLASARSDGQKNYSEQQYVDSLPEDAKNIYNDIKSEVLLATGLENIDFSMSNLAYLGGVSLDKIMQNTDKSDELEKQLNELKNQLGKG